MKDIIEKFSPVEALVVICAGIALICCVITRQSDAALALGGGLIGFLGKAAVSPSTETKG